jgi:hypothetical protein
MIIHWDDGICGLGNVVLLDDTSSIWHQRRPAR